MMKFEKRTGFSGEVLSDWQPASAEEFVAMYKQFDNGCKPGYFDADPDQWVGISHSSAQSGTICFIVQYRNSAGGMGGGSFNPDRLIEFRIVREGGAS